MKSVTEFWSHNLMRGLQSKNELAAAGKSPEEIKTALGESFKMEGDKLKHFVNAMEVASQNTEKLARVLVVTLNEGESAPPKATKIEEAHYIPEFQGPPPTVAAKRPDPKAGRGGSSGKGKGKDSGAGKGRA